MASCCLSKVITFLSFLMLPIIRIYAIGILKKRADLREPIPTPRDILSDSFWKKVADLRGVTPFEWKRFQVATRFELEFDFRLIPVPTISATGTYPLFFMEGESMKMQVWIASWNTLEIVHYYTGAEDRKRRSWARVAKMNLTDASFDQFRAAFGHLFVRISDGISDEMLTVRVNNLDTQIRAPPHPIFEKDEIIKIWLFEGVYIINGGIRHVVF